MAGIRCCIELHARVLWPNHDAHEGLYYIDHLVGVYALPMELNLQQPWPSAVPMRLLQLPAGRSQARPADSIVEVAPETNLRGS